LQKKTEKVTLSLNTRAGKAAPYL